MKHLNCHKATKYPCITNYQMRIKERLPEQQLIFYFIFIYKYLT
ncbi:hypothetical protein CVS40_8783 [Lucilia cuprina]|nr:hypothetical protein CVS40_8783 [Lucilia cuprina]